MVRLPPSIQGAMALTTVINGRLESVSVSKLQHAQTLCGDCTASIGFHGITDSGIGDFYPVVYGLILHSYFPAEKCNMFLNLLHSLNFRLSQRLRCSWLGNDKEWSRITGIVSEVRQGAWARVRDGNVALGRRQHQPNDHDQPVSAIGRVYPRPGSGRVGHVRIDYGNCGGNRSSSCRSRTCLARVPWRRQGLC